MTTFRGKGKKLDNFDIASLYQQGFTTEQIYPLVLQQITNLNNQLLSLHLKLQAQQTIGKGNDIKRKIVKVYDEYQNLHNQATEMYNEIISRRMSGISLHNDSDDDYLSVHSRSPSQSPRRRSNSTESRGRSRRTRSRSAPPRTRARRGRGRGQ